MKRQERKQKTLVFLLHLGFFLVVEMIFVILIFHEIPETNLFTEMGVLHLSYRWILIIAGMRRERSTKVFWRFLATYLPIVYHLGIHLFIGWKTLELYQASEHHNITWLITGVIATGFLIYRWENLLHRKYHCDTHHHKAHKKCSKHGHGDCEKRHG